MILSPNKKYNIIYKERPDKTTILPKCPFFRERCLRKECTAFSLRDTYGPRFMDQGEWARKILKDQPYCTALNIFLPRIKKETENGN